MVICSRLLLWLAALFVTSCGQSGGFAPDLSSQDFPFISAGRDHTCGILSSGEAYCWGDDFSGRLGNGATGGDQESPSSVAGGHYFEVISAGQNHTCGIDLSGTAYCWGNDGDGQLGNGATGGDQVNPSAVNSVLKFKDISAGFDHTCAVSVAGAAYCWGDDSTGELGNGATAGDQASPTAVAGGLSFQSIIVASDSTCGVTTAGAAYCWGADFNGEIGNGATTGDQISPAAVVGGLIFSRVDCGDDHCCGLTTSSDAYCWGRDNEGQIGNGGTGGNQESPVIVASGLKYSSVSTGYNHSCGVTSAGPSYCWGGDYGGRLGDGSPHTDQDAPSLVAGSLLFRSISGGNDHGCGVTTSGQGYCWGNDNDGRLGNGSGVTAEQDAPYAVDVPFL